MEIIWLWALTLAVEAKMADHLHRSSPEVEASTQAARSKPWDTVTNRCSMFRRLSRSISESHHLPALRLTHLLKLCYFLGKMQLMAYTKCDIIAKFGKGFPSELARSFAAVPLTFSPYSCLCCIIYWPLHLAQCATVYCRPQQSRSNSIVQDLLPFSGKDVHWVVEWFYCKKKKKQPKQNFPSCVCYLNSCTVQELCSFSHSGNSCWTMWCNFTKSIFSWKKTRKSVQTRHKRGWKFIKVLKGNSPFIPSI